VPTGSALKLRRRAQLTRALRRARNRPGGYWVAAADPHAASQAVTGTLPGRSLHRAALLRPWTRKAGNGPGPSAATTPPPCTSPWMRPQTLNLSKQPGTSGKRLPPRSVVLLFWFLPGQPVPEATEETDGRLRPMSDRLDRYPCFWAQEHGGARSQDAEFDFSLLAEVSG
jgi:hypothetical protein